MAQLVLTDKEKATNQWMDLDNEVLGKLVRQTIHGLLKNDDEKEKIKGVSAAILLCVIAKRANATESITEFKRLLVAGKDTGGWKITVENIRVTKPLRETSKAL